MYIKSISYALLILISLLLQKSFAQEPPPLCLQVREQKEEKIHIYYAEMCDHNPASEACMTVDPILDSKQKPTGEAVISFHKAIPSKDRKYWPNSKQLVTVNIQELLNASNQEIIERCKVANEKNQRIVNIFAGIELDCSRPVSADKLINLASIPFGRALLDVITFPVSSLWDGKKFIEYYSDKNVLNQNIKIHPAIKKHSFHMSATRLLYLLATDHSSGGPAEMHMNQVAEILNLKVKDVDVENPACPLFRNNNTKKTKGSAVTEPKTESESTQNTQ